MAVSSASSRFPAFLSGIHSVGCVDLMHRNLLVRIFYPSEQSEPHEHAKWLPSTTYAKGFVSMVQTLLSSGSDSLPPVDDLMRITIEATYKSPVSSKPFHMAGSTKKKYPVAILSHGLGGNRCLYSATSIGLASHGYVVANVEHRDESASTSLQRVPGPGAKEGEFDKYVDEWIPFNTNCANGRFEKNVTLRRKQVKTRRNDISEALDLLSILDSGGSVDNMAMENFDFGQFSNRLDTNLCFVIGHSFGGATVIHSLYEDKRFKCGVALDPNLIPVHDEVYTNGFDQPLLFVNSELGYQWEDNIKNIMKLTKPNDGNGVTKTPILTIRQTTHFGFSDFSHVVTGYAGQMLDINVSHRLVIELCDLFLKRFLHGDNSHQSCLDGGNGMSENVMIGTVAC